MYIRRPLCINAASPILRNFQNDRQNTRRERRMLRQRQRAVATSVTVPYLLLRVLTELFHIRDHSIFRIRKCLLSFFRLLNGFKPHAVTQVRHTITLAFHRINSSVFEVGSCMSYFGQDAVLQL